MDIQPIHPEPTSFLRKYIFSTDHKVIAKQFIWAGLVFLAIGGILAMAIRWQWAYPGKEVPVVGQMLLPRSGGVITPSAYASIFTTHGLIRQRSTSASDRPVDARPLCRLGWTTSVRYFVVAKGPLSQPCACEPASCNIRVLTAAR